LPSSLKCDRRLLICRLHWFTMTLWHSPGKVPQCRRLEAEPPLWDKQDKQALPEAQGSARCASQDLNSKQQLQVPLARLAMPVTTLSQRPSICFLCRCTAAPMCAGAARPQRLRHHRTPLFRGHGQSAAPLRLLKNGATESDFKPAFEDVRAEADAYMAGGNTPNSRGLSKLVWAWCARAHVSLLLEHSVVLCRPRCTPSRGCACARPRCCQRR
jgi:hypothetical protein